MCHLRFGFFSSSSLFYLIAAIPAIAQIVPDATLPNNSLVIQQGNTSVIEGGTRAGGNLFHSFREFSVPNGDRAFFNNASDIQNIFSRVTGNSISNIDGLIRANGVANLFLINPNGIIFGSNAKLNIGGSFLASTANSFKFADGTEFSVNPTNPPALLSINVPIGLQYGENPGSIQMYGSRLQLQPGKNLALLGGNVSLNGAILQTLGGRVELGGSIGVGTIEFNVDGSLRFPADVQRSDVLLTNQARVDVRPLNIPSWFGIPSGVGGSITINARNLEILAGSRLSAGITQGLGQAGTQAGDINLNATGAINIAGSYLFNNVGYQATGQGGNITIFANSFSLIDGAQIGAITFGQGNAGSISVQANESVVLTGNGTAIFGTVEPPAIGNSGGISIKAGSLSMTDGALLITTTYGRGNAGDISIQVDDSVSLVGGESVRFPPLPFVDDLTIVVTKNDIFTGGSSPDSPPIRAFLSATSPQHTPSLTTSPSEDGEDSSPDPPPFFEEQPPATLPDSAPPPPPLISNPRGIPTPKGSSNSMIFPSTSIFSTVASGAVGDAGDITIQARSLSLTSGAGVLTATRAQGNAGTIRVYVKDAVNLSGVSPDGFSSGLFTSSERADSLRGGDLIVNSRELHLSDGAVLSARTRSAYNGGDIRVNVSSLELTGGAQVLATAFGSGPAGNISINTTDSIIISGSDPTYATRLEQFGREIVDPDGSNSGLSVSGRGAGAAGNLNVTANSIRLNNRGTLSAETVSGDRGNIILQTRSLYLGGGSRITTNATETATGGRISINTDTITALDNSDITANSQQSRGGTVTINARGTFGIQSREQENPTTSDITATGGTPDLNGTVQINAPEVDPSSGLIQLAENFIDATSLVDKRCSSQQQQNTFIVTGRGGLPTPPNQPLSGDLFWEDLRVPLLRGGAGELMSGGAYEWGSEKIPFTLSPFPFPLFPTSHTPHSTPSPQIVEAQGWYKDINGNIILTAQAASITPHGSWLNFTNCPPITRN